MKNFANIYNPIPPAVPPKTPSVKKCDILHPATIIIIDTTAIITSEALRCDCTPNNTKIAGDNINNGLKKPFLIFFNSSLCFGRYVAKNTINPIFVSSDGWNDDTTGKFIHLLAPFTVLPKTWN